MERVVSSDLALDATVAAVANCAASSPACSS